ncbi:hypothetical protein CAOG_02460 [Capsaspora owczarzaki ATCC 30864]|uniref:non-specific protein-tyrosine kinase n=1 Tax=Capsaspora owczarzaki (strain ATCC 30864) TaxID=595528 RepID=A0A0D2X1S2_CAPO3|nr:hypothetical protein CAOG_02460 [Capsaspora owczarzaki ATCC 30864]KJE91304.1 TKL protein kinase [Capsaspora owczarzaki ATCC 30864]|eukprot:XP_004349210.1 hypothetical protein CAOG_02460 [Capsaspora owczarzaki ATCC 30864]
MAARPAGATPLPPPRFVALFDFDATTTGDLGFKKGDTLLIINKDDANWWTAKASATGKVGTIPANYVVPIPAENEKPTPPVGSIPTPTAATAAAAAPPPAAPVSKSTPVASSPSAGEEGRESNNKVRWFHGKITREETEKLFEQHGSKDGLFLLRESVNYPGDYTLCVCFERGVQHYRVEKVAEGGKLTVDQESYFDDMIHLVDHYRMESDGLCTRLRQPIVKRGPQPKIDPKIFKKAGWEIQRSEVILGNILGSGNFGEVYEATWRSQKVAVKTLKGENAMEDFLAEASVMTRLRHKNLVQLLGVCLDITPIYIITEFMSKGSLQDYLRSRGRREIPMATLFSFAQQVSSAMVYLESRNFVHRDLAARNVLVGDDNTAKVADFGLAKNANEQDVVEGGKIPIKWTAPEALLNNTYTNKSDVWSFGVVLWEVYSFGRIPYPRMSHTEVVQEIKRGYRMESPEGCPTAIYNIMLACWQIEVDRRPSFREIETQLEKAAGTAM